MRKLAIGLLLTSMVVVGALGATPINEDPNVTLVATTDGSSAWLFVQNASDMSAYALVISLVERATIDVDQSYVCKADGTKVAFTLVKGDGRTYVISAVGNYSTQRVWLPVEVAPWEYVVVKLNWFESAPVNVFSAEFEML